MEAESLSLLDEKGTKFQNHNMKIVSGTFWVAGYVLDWGQGPGQVSGISQADTPAEGRWAAEIPAPHVLPGPADCPGSPVCLRRVAQHAQLSCE